MSNKSLKEVKRNQREGFLLGFFGGGGLFSVLVLGLYNLFKGSKDTKSDSKDGKGPESFEL